MPPKARHKGHVGKPVANTDTAKRARDLRSNASNRTAGIVKEKPTPKGRVVAECKICASWRLEKYFKEPGDINICEHLRDTCKLCVEKMIKAKITDRALQKAVLACPFPDCPFAFKYGMVKEIVSKGVFENWDKALVKHYLSVSEEFMTCLNPECAHHFSVDLVKTECNRKKKIDCPYCGFNMCVKCSRPWHTGKGCGGAEAEEETSEKMIQQMGAKKCPSCGLNIEKDGGCDHMTCKNCNYNFCFVCLMQYTPTMQHGPGCPHGRQNIANDAGNFWEGDLHALGLLDPVPARNGNVAVVGAPPVAQPALVQPAPARPAPAQPVARPVAQNVQVVAHRPANVPNAAIPPRLVPQGQPENTGFFLRLFEFLGENRANRRLR